ncbi:MAG: polysaccharide deacetylase family protein [Flavobacteriales bacterium]
MVLVFVENVTNRLQYTFDFIFKIRGVDYSFTLNKKEFIDSIETKLNYSNFNLDSSPTIIPSVLLFEEGITEQELGKSNFENEDCLSIKGVVDPIASVFYILTRYEEYSCLITDKHGRFPYDQSILNSFNWVEKAKCDRWSESIIEFCGVDLSLISRSIEILPTFDIDNTYAYKLKEGKRNFLSRLKDTFRGETKRLAERKDVLNGGVDPYDTFSKIKDIAGRFNNTKIFWLIGKLSKFDRNISIENEKHKELIHEIGHSVEINLHPSYASNSRLEFIEEEKIALESVLKRKINSSRQHFLKLRLPLTFQVLEDAGFQNEYSMGFAENVGFRCGTARPHLWFDLWANFPSELTIHPLVYMDGSLNEYMKLSIDESKVKISELYAEVKKYGGEFTFLWHNETIGDYGHWKGWSAVLEHTLNLGHE